MEENSKIKFMRIRNKYSIGFSNPTSQCIEIEVVFENINESETIIQLPSWRPGRYEIGNFAKNILHFQCFNDEEKLTFQKVSKDSWKVNTENVSTLRITYQYYAAELNAGSSYLDADQLYVNPVNCCVYIPERIDEALSLQINIPENYEIATGISNKVNKTTFLLKNFDELADNPFIASENLQHFQYECEGYTFHIWFQGIVDVNEKRLLTDFKKFTQKQIEIMGDFPVSEFHFLIQATSFPFYHGVEHQTSTVLALGPGHQLFTSYYDELLGVSSHELFHAWNVKFIRPLEMFPYDFTKENYSRLGYIYEGLTTWYGDVMLYRSGVFDKNQYLKAFNEYLKRHFLNYARHHYSVAASSFDTWLDGYVAGIPYRKVSIYTEGSLIAFMLDAIIREETKNAKSLDDLMRELYSIAKAGKAYSEQDIPKILKTLCTYDFDDFFQKYVNGQEDFTKLLKKSAEFFEFKFTKEKYLSDFELKAGLILSESNGNFTIQQTAPESPALQVGLLVGDQILAIDHQKMSRKWLNNPLNNKSLEITVFSKDILKSFILNVDEEKYYLAYKLE
jgi:predicted metalloprotease with PDZ domain